jgi:hypothetical protein
MDAHKSNAHHRRELRAPEAVISLLSNLQAPEAVEPVSVVVRSASTPSSEKSANSRTRLALR